MRKSVWLIVVFCAAAWWMTQQSASAGEHEFRYKAPAAKSVELMCDFNGWKSVAMTKGDDGVWKVKVDLPSGTHGYKFLVDGKDWMFDPENSNKTKVNDVENSSIEVK